MTKKSFLKEKQDSAKWKVFLSEQTAQPSLRSLSRMMYRGTQAICMGASQGQSPTSEKGQGVCGCSYPAWFPRGRSTGTAPCVPNQKDSPLCHSYWDLLEISRMPTSFKQQNRSSDCFSKRESRGSVFSTKVQAATEISSHSAYLHLIFLSLETFPNKG